MSCRAYLYGSPEAVFEGVVDRKKISTRVYLMVIYRKGIFAAYILRLNDKPEPLWQR